MPGWTLLHGFLGVVTLAGLAVALWAALARPEPGLKTLRLSTLVITVTSIALVLLGDIAYVGYRSSARAVILASDRPWIHRTLMEFKEHMAHFLPLILLAALVMVYAEGKRVRGETGPRRILASLLLLSLAITLAALILGAYIAATAPVL